MNFFNHFRFKEKKRVLFLATAVFALFSLLIIQFFKVQIIEQDKWIRHAKAQQQALVDEPFMRGGFYSNNSIRENHIEVDTPLVLDVSAYNLHIDPHTIPEPLKEEVATKLFHLVDYNEKEREHFFYHFSLHKNRNRRIAMWLDKANRDSIMEWWLSYAKQHKIPSNAIFFEEDYKRSYPYGHLLGQVLHTIRDLKDESTSQGFPTGGLELYFHKYLSGHKGKRRYMRSPLRPLDKGYMVQEPENGANIYLTINHHLQAICETALENGVKKAKAKGGWAVLMDPFSGEILALAQYPFFYPSEYKRYFNDSELMDDTRVKAICDSFEPGSIMKPLTLAINLKANQECLARHEKPLFSPEEKIATSRGDFPGRTKPLQDTSFHRYLNMYHAMQKSSNIYFATLVDRVIKRFGSEWYREQLQQIFGLGEATGVEFPSESLGLLPRIGKKHPNGALEWSQSTPYSLAIGHNLLVNSIHMVRAYSIFANGGYMVQPSLVRKIVRKTKNGEEILIDNTGLHTIEKAPRVLDKVIVDEVIRSMKLVVKQGGGGQKSMIYGYTQAGKTGTANKVIEGGYSKKQYLSSFIGFAPLSKPRFVLLVTVNDPAPFYIPGEGYNYYGGKCAAPIYRDIATKVLQYMGVAPDNPYNYPNGDPRRKIELSDGEQEANALMQLYDQWNKEVR